MTQQRCERRNALVQGSRRTAGKAAVAVWVVAVWYAVVVQLRSRSCYRTADLLVAAWSSNRERSPAHLRWAVLGEGRVLAGYAQPVMHQCWVWGFEVSKSAPQKLLFCRRQQRPLRLVCLQWLGHFLWSGNTLLVGLCRSSCSGRRRPCWLGKCAGVPLVSSSGIAHSSRVVLVMCTV